MLVGKWLVHVVPVRFLLRCYDDCGKTFHQEHMDCPVPEDCGFEDLECDLLDEDHRLKPLLNEKHVGCGSFHRVLEVIVWLMQVGFFCWEFRDGYCAIASGRDTSYYHRQSKKLRLVEQFFVSFVM